MSTFGADDVRRLARLARLELEPDELAAFAEQLGDILEFARQIQAVDTSTVSEAVELPAAALREDEPRPSLERDAVVASAPDHDPATGLIKVPRVLGS